VNSGNLKGTAWTPPWGWRLAIAVLAIAGVTGVLHQASGQTNSGKVDKTQGESSMDAAGTKIGNLATFGSGCFWCTEAVFEQLRGVQKVVSGYSGGPVKNPTYEQVCGGATGHAEVVQITFDPAEISFDDLLEVFWKSHDPTTLNRQGHDAGTQYRSVIFYHDETQRRLAEERRDQLDRAGIFDRPIVTEIAPFQGFYPAEDYHQEYFRLNGRQPYCSTVIRPKVEKVQELFQDRLKSDRSSPVNE
jgi:peptide-methionine (S)-S-oxide reductase